MNNNTPHTPTDDRELRKAYRRCDVSNNGTVDPMNEDEFVAYIHQYGNTRAVKARIELHRELSHPHSKSWQNQLYNLDLERLSELTQPQKENK